MTAPSNIKTASEKSAPSVYTNDTDRALFDSIHHAIVDRQLFLDPLFCREKYIKLGLINKNKVARLMHKYAGNSLNGYINDLRLDYAVELMRGNPDAPIKAIAIDAGFKSLRTFYRLFSAKYGVTPSVFMTGL